MALITITKQWETEVEVEIPDGLSVPEIAEFSRSVGNSEHTWESTEIRDGSEKLIFSSN